MTTPLPIGDDGPVVRDFGSGILYIGDCRDGLRWMKEEGIRVQMCISSPPFIWQRHYLEHDHPQKYLEIGLEPDPLAYVAALVEVFSLVHDVLAEDGVCFLNLGDKSNGSGGAGGDWSEGGRKAGKRKPPGHKSWPVLKRRSLIGAPWRVAHALEENGYVLLCDIIWWKTGMSGVPAAGRPTVEHEYVFELAKNPNPYFDDDAIAVPYSEEAIERFKRVVANNETFDPNRHKTYGDGHNRSPMERLIRGARKALERGKRNCGSVWKIPNEGYPGEHTATFPPELVRRCILAGSRPGDIVLDPFMGSGTSAMVAEQLGRKWVGCELNSQYVKLVEKRLRQPNMIGGMV